MASYKSVPKKDLFEKGNCTLDLYYPLVIVILVGAKVKYSGLKKLDRNFVTLKFLSYEKIEKNI